MRRAAPLARAALQVTMYTMFFLYLGILVVSCAELMSFATERSLGFAQAVERLMFLPLTAAIVALLLGLALGMLLGLAVATALLVVQGRSPSRRRLRFTVELITLLTILPGAYVLSEWTPTLIGAPAQLLAATGFVLPLIALRWGRIVADKYADDLRRLELEDLLAP